jgi:hypothetical protein
VSRLRYHLDEDCQSAALAAALRQHGIEVVTTNEANIAGMEDDAQLEHGARQQTVIVTNNICDYAALHTRWLAQGRSHAGILSFRSKNIPLVKSSADFHACIPRSAPRRYKAGWSG